MAEIEHLGDYHFHDKYLLEHIKSEEYAVAYGLDSKMRHYSAHYSFIKTKYKALATTWLLATFIAVGYLIRGVEIGLPVSNYIAIAFLSVLASLGILLLYFLDVGIYHRLLEAIFVESLKLEKKYPFLSDTEKNIIKLLVKKRSKHPIVYEGLFYAFYVLVLNLIADLSLYFFFSPAYPTGAIVLTSILLILQITFTVFLSLLSDVSGVTKLFKKKKSDSLPPL